MKLHVLFSRDRQQKNTKRNWCKLIAMEIFGTADGSGGSAPCPSIATSFIIQSLIFKLN